MASPGASRDSPSRIRTLIQQSRFAEAESLSRALLAATEAAAPFDSARLADALDLLVEAEWRLRGNPSTLALAERAVQVRERTMGPHDPGLARSLDNLGIVRERTGERETARALFTQALRIRERSLGPEHPEVARSLSNLGLVSDLVQARSLHERALVILERAHGPEHRDVAASLNRLGIVSRNLGEYTRARQYHERALAIRMKLLGPDHRDVAASLNNVANLLRDIGDYEAARPLYERSIAIRERIHGSHSMDVVNTEANLAILLKDMGELAEARALLERALAIQTRIRGPDHSDVAWTLSTLGDLRARMGDVDDAEDMLQRALAIRIKVFGSDHQDVAECLANLARLRERAGDPAGAKRLYQEAAVKWDRVIGPGNRLSAEVLVGLSRLEAMTGQVAAAESLCRRALETQEAALGRGHPDVAATLVNLGTLLQASGRTAEARSAYERAIHVWERAYGRDHPAIVEALTRLSALLLERGERNRALELALAAESIGRRHFQLTVRSLPEREALAYAWTRPSALAVALHASLGDAHPSGERLAWDALIRSRAIVLDEMAARRRVLSQARDPGTDSLEQGLVSARTRLANLIVRGPGAQQPAVFRALLDDARREADQAERLLAERNAPFRQARTASRIGLGQVEMALPPQAALVAFVRYGAPASRDGRGLAREPSRASTVDALPEGAAGSSVARYAVFVLSASPRRVWAIPLGPGETIDSLVSAWRAAISPPGAAVGPSDTATVARAGTDLRGRVWDPVTARLGPARIVFVVTDGALHLVNLAALPSEQGGYLIESGPVIHYLANERDLANLRRSDAVGVGLLAVGAPAFDEISPGPGGEESRADGTSGGRPTEPPVFYRGPTPTCDEFRSLRFMPLPASGREVEEVAALWRGAGREVGGQRVRDPRHTVNAGQSVAFLVGRDANESFFKARAGGHRVLHLATHGFVVDARCGSVLDGTRDIAGVVPAQRAPAASATRGNPLLLSGLALAGANRREAAGPDMEDGVLTSEEIASLDLSACEWAVLSACETGVGAVWAGEGVSGLRRAFQVAGARTLIMSLWPVEDEATRRWMRALYEGRLKRGRSTAEAMREASLEVLRERRALGEDAGPLYWGAFVAAGDWR